MLSVLVFHDETLRRRQRYYRQAPTVPKISNATSHWIHTKTTLEAIHSYKRQTHLQLSSHSYVCFSRQRIFGLIVSPNQRKNFQWWSHRCRGGHEKNINPSFPIQRLMEWWIRKPIRLSQSFSISNRENNVDSVKINLKLFVCLLFFFQRKKVLKVGRWKIGKTSGQRSRRGECPVWYQVQNERGRLVILGWAEQNLSNDLSV